jgi:hypothetical protein
VKAGEPIGIRTQIYLLTIVLDVTTDDSHLDLVAARWNLPRDGDQLPFHGSLQAIETDVVVPPNLLVNGRETGTATHLGRFTATFTATVTLATASATGSIRLVAANGDSLDATFSGHATATTEPNVVAIEEVATISGGTGRFAGAERSGVLSRPP